MDGAMKKKYFRVDTTAVVQIMKKGINISLQQRDRGGGGKEDGRLLNIN